jgi:hypothetical protein
MDCERAPENPQILNPHKPVQAFGILLSSICRTPDKHLSVAYSHSTQTLRVKGCLISMENVASGGTIRFFCSRNRKTSVPIRSARGPREAPQRPMQRASPNAGRHQGVHWAIIKVPPAAVPAVVLSEDRRRNTTSACEQPRVWHNLWQQGTSHLPHVKRGLWPQGRRRMGAEGAAREVGDACDQPGGASPRGQSPDLGGQTAGPA